MMTRRQFGITLMILTFLIGIPNAGADYFNHRFFPGGV